MKQNNDLIILDFEATDDHQYIIDIGAVYLNKNLDKIDSYSRLVKPGKGQQVTSFITELTGITNEMLSNEKEFNEVCIEFENWANTCNKITGGNSKLNQIRLCAFGVYFDFPLLRRNYTNIGREYPFHGGGYDVKSLAYLWCALSNKRSDKLSVSHIANEMKIAPTGKYHRAIVDAESTAKILQRIFKDLNTGTFLNGELYKIIKE